MDFKDVIKQLAERAEKLRGNLQTEEATKNALIMPFLQALGYDVFNPVEVVPEFTCDIGTKKEEKVDYAILKDGNPIILVECKHCEKNLDPSCNQLLRYYHVTTAKFAILTNGLSYRFYTDLEIPNKMDEKPFLEINLLDVRGNQLEELKKFHKAYFDVENILSSASQLKYTSQLKAVLMQEFAHPSPEFVKLLTRQVYEKTITSKLLEQFTQLVQRSISGHISDLISDRLKTALDTEVSIAEQTQKNEEKEAHSDSQIVTTPQELEGYYILKSILRKHIPPARITYRDAQTYFAVFLDNNNRKLVCRLYLNSPTNKRIAFVGDDKKEIPHKISSIDELYNFSEQIIAAATKHS